MEREYIAFISYRHTPVDIEAAAMIERLIERYHIPKKLRKDGKSRLGMVFRDTDELNVASDLSQSLRTAMDHSEYLIVICSPQYRESMWCREELAYFLKHHDVDHVLPVLVDGEPADAFPEEIRIRSVVDGEEVVSEPLAANVAGRTIREMKQNVKREYLRLVARMLGRHYDELVERQRRYERRKRIAVIGAVFAVLLAFIGTLLVKNAQVNARYQEARENQARYLSTVALEQYEKGDAASALESVLTIMPEGKKKGPVVPEQMYALATVLNAYNDSYVAKNYISLPKNDQKVFSEDGEKLFSYTSDQLQVYDTGSGELCYTFRVSTFLKEEAGAAASAPGLSDASIEAAVPAENGKFLLLLSQHIFEFDINDPAYYRYITSTETDSFRAIDYTQGKLAFCAAGGSVWVYDCTSGKLLYERDFNSGEETVVKYSAKTLAWNGDGSILAVGLDYSNTEIQPDLFREDPELNRQEEEYFQKNPPLGLILIDPLSGEMKKISSQRTTGLFFAGDAIGAVHSEYTPYAIASHHVWTSAPVYWSAAVYDAASGESIYRSDPILSEACNTFGFSQGQIAIDDKVRSVYDLWIGKTGMVLDAENGSILYTETFHADVVDMEYHRGVGEMIVLSNGSLQFVTFSEGSHYRTIAMKLDIAVEDAAQAGEQYYLLTSTGMIQCGISLWEAVTDVTVEETGLKDYQAHVFRYFDTEQGTLRLVGFEAPGVSRLDEDCSALALYPCLSDEMLFSYVSDDPESKIKAYYIAKDGTHISILERKSDGGLFISGFSLPDGALEFSHQLPAEKMSYSMEAGFSEDGKTIWITEWDTVHLYGLNDGDIGLTEYQTDDGIVCPTLTEDGRYLLWLEKESLVLLQVETGEAESVALPEQYDVDKYSLDNTLLLGQNGCVILYNGKREVLLYDRENTVFLEPIPVSSGSEIALLGNRAELLVMHDETVSLYDLSTGECESTLTLPGAADSLITDTGSDAFAVYRGWSFTIANDDGWVLGGQYLVSVDEARNMYLTAFIRRVGNDDAISPSGGEIINATSEGFAFKRILDFEQLVAMASRDGEAAS